MGNSCIDYGTRENVTLRAVCLSVTVRCTLRCKLCVVRAGYVKNSYHPTIEHLQKQVEELFSVVSFVEDFNISGGEPFLRSDLGRLLKYLNDNHNQQIGRIRIFTSGTILTKDHDFFEQAREWNKKFSIVVSKYMLSDKCDSIADSLQEQGISFEIRDYTNTLYCDGWVDFGDLSLKHNDGEANLLYQKCAVKGGFYIYMEDGQFFACPKAKHVRDNGLGDDCIDFMSDLSVQEKRERLISLLSQDYYESCKYCNGICKDSKRFLPAEQI